jgi:hypothetical protein
MPSSSQLIRHKTLVPDAERLLQLRLCSNRLREGRELRESDHHALYVVLLGFGVRFSLCGLGWTFRGLVLLHRNQYLISGSLPMYNLEREVGILPRKTTYVKHGITLHSGYIVPICVECT